MDIHAGAITGLVGIHLLGAGRRFLRTLTALAWTGWRKLRASAAVGWGKLRAWRKAAARWRTPIWALGGVTTLRQPMHPLCFLCHQEMVSRNDVRTLSCNHTLHKACIDWHLREHDMACPVCNRTATLVMPWKAPPSHLIKEVNHGRGVFTLEVNLKYRCVICQKKMKAPSKIQRLACLHSFHFACKIEKWLCENNRRCPLCRKPDIPVPEKEGRLSAMRRRIGSWFRRFSVS